MNKLAKISIYSFLGLLLVGILSIYLVLAEGKVSDKVEINYKDNNMTIEFKDGKNIIGQTTLKSHKTYDEVLEITSGKNKTVIWYEFSNFKEIKLDALGEVEFIDMREKIANESYTKLFDGKIELMNESKIMIKNPNYLNPINKTYKFVYQDEKGEWIDYDLKDIPKENIIIGVQTDLGWGEFIDVRLNVFNNKLNRHALVKGTNCGFVTEAPTSDPGGTPAFNVDRASWGFKCVSPVGAGKIVEIGWYTPSSSEESNFEVGIYTHNAGDNNPEAVVGWDQTNAKGTNAGWKVVTGLNIEISAETTYWIAFQLDNTITDTAMYGTTTGGEKIDYKNFQNSLPSPWGSSSGTSGKLAPIYAVWEAAGDSTPPYFTDGTPTDQTIEEGNALSYDINATDETAFDCFTVNDTTNFKINCNGLLENNTVLSVAMYNLNITINDSSNNLNSTLMWVNVTAITQCNPTLNENWSISDAQVCNGVAITTGTGSIIIVSGGTLHLLNGANITTTKLYLQTTGDQVFISSKSKLVTG